MFDGLHHVASALETATRNQEIVSENLAHSVTPGYRRQGLIFEVMAPASQNQISGRDRDPYTHFETGPLQQTNNPYDLALAGDGFFVLDGPNGPLYTRNGSFAVTPTGELLSHGGNYRLSGDGGGALQLPPNATQVAIASDGTVSANGTQVGKVRVATFAQPETLRRVGTTLFEGDNPQTPPPGSVTIAQGYREGSNVQPVQEMVSMMVGMRHYEAAQKALRAISETIQQNTRAQP